MAAGWSIFLTPDLFVGPGERIDGLRDDAWLEEMVRAGRAVRVAESEAA